MLKEIRTPERLSRMGEPIEKLLDEVDAACHVADPILNWLDTAVQLDFRRLAPTDPDDPELPPAA